MFMPLDVICTSLREIGIAARGARAPSTYSCRESAPDGTGACQMFAAESCSVQPLTCCPPDSTGVAPAAACQKTVCPLVPESAAVKTSGADNRYVPPASCTAMSPRMLAVIERNEDWAWAREHGAVAVQAVTEPVGETYKVAVVAAWDTAGMPKAAAASAAAAARIEGRERPPRRRVPRITVLPLAGRVGSIAGMCLTSVPHESR